MQQQASVEHNTCMKQRAICCTCMRKLHINHPQAQELVGQSSSQKLPAPDSEFCAQLIEFHPGVAKGLVGASKFQESENQAQHFKQRGGSA